MKTFRFTPLNGGFTVLELLVVAAILAIIVGFSFGVSGGLSKMSDSAKCVSNLKQIGAATAQYVADNGGALPHYPPTSDDGALGYATVGAWHWHLAPYLEIPRSTSSGVNLGLKNSDGLPGPVVFTCPAQKEEGDPENFKRLFTYPSMRPVSYAPSSRTKGNTLVPYGNKPSQFVSPLKLQQVVRPSQKIWLSDSRTSEVLNVSDARWGSDYSPRDAWPRWSFSRHRGGGNALFFDGHVEWLALATFTGGNLSANLKHYFYPLLDE